MNNFNLSALNMFTTCIINYTQGARSESFLFMKLSWYIVLINEIIINNHNYIMLFCWYSRAIFKWIWWKSWFKGHTIHGRWSYVVRNCKPWTGHYLSHVSYIKIWLYLVLWKICVNDIDMFLRRDWWKLLESSLPVLTQPNQRKPLKSWITLSVRRRPSWSLRDTEPTHPPPSWYV